MTEKTSFVGSRHGFDLLSMRGPSESNDDIVRVAFTTDSNSVFHKALKANTKRISFNINVQDVVESITVEVQGFLQQKSHPSMIYTCGQIMNSRNFIPYWMFLNQDFCSGEIDFSKEDYFFLKNL